MVTSTPISESTAHTTVDHPAGKDRHNTKETAMSTFDSNTLLHRLTPEVTS